MRVTRSMMLESMEYWSSKQLEKLNEVSTVVASGQQINKPSDDPTGTRQVLEDKVTLSSLNQYENNAELARTWISLCNTTLSSVYSLLQEAQDYVTSDITSDSSDASTTAQTLQNIYDQISSMANEYYESGSYMFSGDRSDTKPFSTELTISGGTASDISYNLADDASTITIEICDDNGNVVRTLTESNELAGTNTVSWDGLDNSGNALADGDYAFEVTAADSGGSAVASYVAYNGSMGTKEFTIGKDNTISLNNNGDSIYSSSLKVLSEMITALEDNSTNNVSTNDFADALSCALSDIKNQEVLLSNASTLMTNTSERLDSDKVTIENRISDIEVGDTTIAATELTSQETAYEVTENALASVLKMSKLSDYM